MMEGAIRAELPREQELRARAEWPFQVGLVYLQDLIVDDTYQRPPHHQFIAEIASHFDETLVGCIDVNERPNSSYAVLDGQQRLRAMQQVGKTTCYASVYQGMSVPDEAGFFFRKNKDRKSMNVYYAFRARTIAGDPEAIEIRKAVEDQGYVLSSSSNDREAIGAVRAVETAWGYSSEIREQALTPTLRTLHQSVFGRKDSLSGSLIQGVGRFWQNYSDDEVDFDALTGVLLTLGPAAMLSMGRERQMLSSSTGGRKASLPWTMSRLIGEEYNRRLRGGQRGNFSGKLDLNRLGY